MKILLLDNYDSFTYNLLHYLELNSDASVEVFRNDEISIPDADRFDKIVLSPGPGLPNEAGRMNELILKYAPSKSILGVCLGMQAMAEVFGGKLKNLDRVMHGVSRKVNITDPKDALFRGIPQEFLAGRYHSWVVDTVGLPDCIRVTAMDDMENIMAIRHKEYNICGVQFHPESVMTEYGKEILNNWMLSGR